MDDLAAAQKQLEHAIARLEAALAEHASGGDAAIEKALADARADYENLRQVADNVSGRIDTIIARLQATLGEDLPRDA